MRFSKRKVGIIMTNVLFNAENIIDTYEENKNISNKRNSKLELILLYLKMKDIIDDNKSLINEYIIKDKTINSGRATIKGTRVTPEDIGRILVEKENLNIKDIMKEYTSLEDEKQVLAGLMYYVQRNISLKNILFAK